jgi:hypothetical protein
VANPSIQHGHGSWKLVTAKKAAEILTLAPSTVHCRQTDCSIAAGQITRRTPLHNCINNEIHARLIQETPQGSVPMLEATRLLGVSRQRQMVNAKIFPTPGNVRR